MANISFDTAENNPRQVCQLSVSRSSRRKIRFASARVSCARAPNFHLERNIIQRIWEHYRSPFANPRTGGCAAACRQTAAGYRSGSDHWALTAHFDKPADAAGAPGAAATAGAEEAGVAKRKAAGPKAAGPKAAETAEVGHAISVFENNCIPRCFEIFFSQGTCPSLCASSFYS